MPLLKSKSKKAFSKNIEAEMKARKPQDQALAIAYSVKRKAPKKMATGGDTTAPKGTEVIDSPKGFGKIIIVGKRSDTPKMAEGGIFDKLESAVQSATHNVAKTGALGTAAKATADKADNPRGKGSSSTSDTKPVKDSAWGSSRYAEGGQVKSKQQPKKHPMIVKGSGFSTKLRDQEAELESAMPPASPKEQPEQAYNEEEADKSGPDVSALHMKKMAEGGSINGEISIDTADEDGAEHPAGLESSDSSIRPVQSEYMANHMKALAEGGMLDEIEEDHHASVAAAIMAKRKRMAEGGQVDIAHNNSEEPNAYYAANEAVLKENMNSEMAKMSQPEDSNEIGHDIDSDKHDRIAEMRRRMKAKRA